MSKRRNKKDKQKKKASPQQEAKRPAAAPKVAASKVATPRVQQKKKTTTGDRALTFGPDTYKWMAIGFGLILVGLFLMAGARGDNFAEFDESYIYGFRRITLAPIVILGGIGTVAYAILKK